jgi:hypothetical protein
MIVATVAQHYRLSLLPGARVFPVPGLTLRPSTPLLARILVRELPEGHYSGPSESELTPRGGRRYRWAPNRTASYREGHP